MSKQALAFVVCILAMVFLGGCASTGGILQSPLADRSITKEAENDPFPVASQVGLAQKQSSGSGDETL